MANRKTDYRTKLAILPSDMVDVLEIKLKLDDRRAARIFIPLAVLLVVILIACFWSGTHDFKRANKSSVHTGQMDVQALPQPKQFDTTPHNLSEPGREK